MYGAKDDLINKLIVAVREGGGFDPELAWFIRKRAGLTQEQLAALVQVARPSISRWETGTRQPQGAALDRYQAVLSKLATTTRRP